MKSKSFDPLIIVLFSLILSLPMRGQDYIPKFVTDETILDLANEVTTNGWIHFRRGIREDDLLTRYVKNLGISNKNQLVEKRRWTDSEGYQHVKYRQVFEGFEIPSAEFTLHLRDGDVEIAHGFLVEDAKLQIGKLIDENDALAVAMQTVNATIFKWEDESEENDLKERAGDFKATYYPKAIKKLLSRSPNISIDALVPCYEFTIYSLEPYDARIIAVDARNGQIFSNLPAYREICTPSGTNQAQTLYNGNQYITTAKEGTKYYLKDCSANFEVRQYAASWSNAQRLEDADNIWNHDQDCVGAFWAISKSRTYFSAKYGDLLFFRRTG